MLRVSLDTVIFLFLAVFHTTAAVKSIAAKGNLTCDEYPAGQILVRLFKVDEDSIEFLEQTHTDEAGCFELVGRSRSDSIWRPVLNIYHDCDDAKNVSFKRSQQLSRIHHLKFIPVEEVLK
ncbi:Transthyretin-like family protein [Ancylostoma ceylanicum]|uniref:Transthyretin-like family protein n=1 Tax=Ancylostoma ceylanicum TaxID=53326 RepID=A0A0D6MC74_9BILA|nr:Transthyretin-like family protein [Ancylostoma ceylanicum]